MRRALVATWLACLWVAHPASAPAQAPDATGPKTKTPAAAEAPAQAPDDGEQPAPAAPADAGVETEALAGQLAGAMTRLAAERKQHAMAAFERREYGEALQRLQQAQALSPDDAELSRTLGRLHGLLGRRQDATAALRHAIALDPGDPEARVLLAELLSSPPTDEQRLAEAAELLREARLRGLGDRRVVLLQARVAAARGRYDAAAEHYAAVTAQPPIDDALRLELGDFHRDRGAREAALAQYRAIGDADPALQRKAAQRIFELSAQREALQLSLPGATAAGHARAAEQVAQARRRLSAQDVDAAAVILRRVLRASPDYAPAHAAQAEVLLARDDHDGAERAYLRALVLGTGDGEVYAALGKLYAHWPAGARNVEAALMLRRALSSRPDLGLHAELAEILRAIGDLPGALRHARAAIHSAPDEAGRKRAVLLAAELQALITGGDGGADARGGDGADTDPLARARAHLGRGATDAALAELQAIAPGARGVEALNLEARILRAARRPAEARKRLQASLDRDDSQAQIHTLLGRMWLQAGDADKARAHLTRGEQLGDGAATLTLVGEAAGDAGIGDLLRLRRLRALRQRVDAVGHSGLSDADRSERVRLLAALDARIARGLSAWLAALMLCIGGVAGVWFWNRGGVGLSQLVQAHPETGPQVQRIVLSLRHEVLKHHTTMLSGLLQSVQRGEPDRALAAHLQRALFGAPGGDGTEGAWSRLQAYVDQLRQIGRAHGVRLNLRHRDPALSRILAGFARLWRVRRRLRALAEGGRASGALREALSAAHDGINERGYAELQALLEQLQVFVVDGAVLQHIFDGVAHEPSIAALHLRPLQLTAEPDALPCALVIARHDFDDVLTNLIRNAIQSSARSLPGEPVEIGLDVRIAVDDITGLQEAQLRVLDRSTETLDSAQLHGQVIERGLGLTADRVARYEGSLGVERQPEGSAFEKAVVLGLPVAS